MSPSKRLFDIVFALFLILFLLPVIAVVAALCLILEGRPVLYLSERMHSPSRGFTLIKFRTMRVSSENTGVTGGDKSDRVSRFQNILRKTRLDELPQLFNIIFGHMSFVGPRPPLRVYVEDYPELYGKVLQSRPGITGLATLRFHEHEESLLAQTDTSKQTDAVYRNRCIPRKATLDLIYQRNASLCFDMALMFETAKKPFRDH